MTNSCAYLKASLFLSVIVLLGGCQPFMDKVSTFKNRNKVCESPIPTQAKLSGPVTKSQKADLQMAIARSVEDQGETEQAIKLYLEVVKKDESRSDAYHRLALLHDRKGDSESAKNFYALALKKDSKNAEIYCDLGYSLYLQQNWSEGEKNLRRAIALNADCLRAHNNLGLLLARTKRENDALTEFAKAGASQADAHCNVAIALASAERVPEAQRQFELALQADPNSQRAIGGLAAVRSQLGESGAGPEAVARRPTQSLTR